MHKLFYFFILGCIWQGCGSAEMPELKNSSWRLKMLGDKAIPDHIGMSLSFGEGGSVTVQGTCNSGSGSYYVSGGKLYLNDIMTSTMACPELSWETEYRQWLSGAGEIKLDSSKENLSIKTEQGTMHFRSPNAKDPAPQDNKAAAYSEFWASFAVTEIQKPLHLYDAPDGKQDTSSYAFCGKPVPNAVWDLFEADEAANFKNGGAFAVLQIKDTPLYLLRVPGKYVVNSLALFRKEGERLKRVETLSWAWSDEGIANAQDAWFTVLNKDNKIDIVLCEYSTEGGKTTSEKYTALVQGEGYQFAPDASIQLSNKDYNWKK